MKIRILAAILLATLLCGCALAVSGCVIQRVLGNPLASPGVIGVNSSAGLAVALVCAMAPAAQALSPLAAFLGALAGVGLVVGIAQSTGASRMTLVLAGVAVSSIFSAGIDAVITFVPEALNGYSDFRIGGFTGVTLERLAPAAGMILPVATLVIPMISSYVRQIRAAVLEELNSNYVTGARARGIPEWKIIFCHVLPNAMFPIITLVGLSVGHLLGGAAIIETLFSWQGIGNMVVEAIRVRDYPLIQGYVIWMAIIYVVVNLVVDISYRFLDPQIRLKRRVD